MKTTLSDSIFNDNEYDSISLGEESVPIDLHYMDWDEEDGLENADYIEIEEEPLEMSEDSQNLHTFEDLHTLKKDIQKADQQSKEEVNERLHESTLKYKGATLDNITLRELNICLMNALDCPEEYDPKYDPRINILKGKKARQRLMKGKEASKWLDAETVMLLQHFKQNKLYGQPTKLPIGADVIDPV